MKVYKGVFVKQNGQQREMIFAYLEDMDPDFLTSKLADVAVSAMHMARKYKDGMKLVWDLEVDNYRVFNFKTQIGELQEMETLEL